jgi:hypothetical protein
MGDRFNIRIERLRIKHTMGPVSPDRDNGQRAGLFQGTAARENIATAPVTRAQPEY